MPELGKVYRKTVCEWLQDQFGVGEGIRTINLGWLNRDSILEEEGFVPHLKKKKMGDIRKRRGNDLGGGVERMNTDWGERAQLS